MRMFADAQYCLKMSLDAFLFAQFTTMHFLTPLKKAVLLSSTLTSLFRGKFWWLLRFEYWITGIIIGFVFSINFKFVRLGQQNLGSGFSCSLWVEILNKWTVLGEGSPHQRKMRLLLYNVRKNQRKHFSFLNFFHLINIQIRTMIAYNWESIIKCNFYWSFSF